MSVKTKQKLLKLREGPKICRRKLNFDNYTKNVKKEGEGSKYVGELYRCDNWIKNDKKKRNGQIMSENINPVRTDKTVKSKGRRQNS